MTKIARYFSYSWAGLFGSLLICALLDPQVVVKNEGISYFGNHWITLLPFAIGMGIASYFVYRAAYLLPLRNARQHLIKEALTTISILLVGVVVTPFSINTFLNACHTLISGALFILELLLAGWLVLQTPRSWLHYGLLLVQSAGALLAMLSLAEVVHFMLTGQLLTQIAFIWLFVRTMELYIGQGYESARGFTKQGRPLGPTAHSPML
jgi:hypothetical protein